MDRLACLLALCLAGSAEIPRCDATVMRVQLFGDSTQAGWDGPANRYAERPPAALLQAALDAHFGPGVTVSSRAVSGSTAVQLVSGSDGHNPPWPGAVDADVVVVNHGINDGAAKRPDLAAYKRALEALAQAPARVVFETPNRITFPSIAAYAQAMRDVAHKRGILVADVYTYTLSMPMSDWAHPSQAQYEAIVRNVLAPKVIAALCQPQTAAPPGVE